MVDSHFTLSCLNTKSLHTSCILIGLYHPTEKCFPPIHKARALLKKASCGPDTAIDVSGPSIEYTGRSKIVDALGLMNLSTMDPLVLPQALSTVMANNVSKLSMINTSGGGFLPNIIFTVLWENKFCCRLHTWTCHYCSILGIQLFLWSWGSVAEDSIILIHLHPYFQHHRYTYTFKFCHP